MNPLKQKQIVVLKKLHCTDLADKVNEIVKYISFEQSKETPEEEYKRKFAEWGMEDAIDIYQFKDTALYDEILKFLRKHLIRRINEKLKK